MERYRNLSGSSGIAKYELIESGIILEFADGKTYLYDEIRPGAALVAEMRERALEGRGLATLVNLRVRKQFRRRLG